MAISKRLAAMVFAGATAWIGGSAIGDVPKDWPTFNGPARDNISKETGLLKEWPKEGPPLAWKATGIGDGHSSVSVANGKIFTAGRIDDSCYVFALNEADGKPLWKSKLGGIGTNDDGQGGKGPRATPTVDGDMIFTEGPAGDVVAMAASDGKEAWHVNLKRDFGGSIPHWGYSESLLVDGDNVICTPGGAKGTVLALNKKTGKQTWRTESLKDPAHYTSLVPADIGNVHQVIVFTPASVAGVDAKDGTVLWKTSRRGKTAVIPTPVVKDNYIYVTSGYGIGCDLFKVNYEAGKFSVEPGYKDENHNMENHTGGVVCVDGYIYGFSDTKNWTCQDMMTGDVKWSDRSLPGKGTIAYADGHLYCRSEKGPIALIEATPTGWKQTGRFNQPERSGKIAWPHLVIANGKLYVRDMDNLFCYDIKAK